MKPLVGKGDYFISPNVEGGGQSYNKMSPEFQKEDGIMNGTTGTDDESM